VDRHEEVVNLSEIQAAQFLRDCAVFIGPPERQARDWEIVKTSGSSTISVE
jgi:hypothetical protein